MSEHTSSLTHSAAVARQRLEPSTRPALSPTLSRMGCVGRGCARSPAPTGIWLVLH